MGVAVVLRVVVHECESAELYSRNTHFMLELVQHAADNAYPPGVFVGVYCGHG